MEEKLLTDEQLNNFQEMFFRSTKFIGGSDYFSTTINKKKISDIINDFNYSIYNNSSKEKFVFNVFTSKEKKQLVEKLKAKLPQKNKFCPNFSILESSNSIILITRKKDNRNNNIKLLNTSIFELILKYKNDNLALSWFKFENSDFDNNFDLIDCNEYYVYGLLSISSIQVQKDISLKNEEFLPEVNWFGELDKKEYGENDDFGNIDKKLENEVSIISSKIFLSVINEIKSGIFIFDINNELFNYNDSFMNLFNLTRKQTVNFTIYDVIELIAKSFKSSGKVRDELYFSLNKNYFSSYEKQSSKINTLFKSIRVKKNDDVLKSNSNNEIESFNNFIYVWFFSDKTEKKQLQHNLKKFKSKNSKLEQELSNIKNKYLQCSKMAELGQLISGIAHEINTPLGAIYCNIDLFTRQFSIIKELVSSSDIDHSKKEKLMKYIDNLFTLNKVSKNASERILEIVEGLKITARKGKLVKTKIDIEKAINITLSVIRHEVKNANVIKEYSNISPIYGYQGQLNQVFTNLLVNASHAIEKNNGKIIIKTSEDKTSVRISIIDNGLGIHPKKIKKIFKKGYTTKKEGVGTGLGLSIVSEIVKNHQGSIEVDSELNKGTTFTITLPKSRL